MGDDKRTRSAHAAETVGILEAGSYFLEEEEVSIATALRAAVTGTRFYPADCSFSSSAPREGRGPRPPSQIEVTAETTIEAGRRLHGLLAQAGEPPSGLCMLNFASAKNPGGGFLNGAQAQEESLARASGLYHCLLAHMDQFYIPHRDNPEDGLYTHRMLHSPLVPFFRNDRGDFVPMWCASVITSAAPNAGVALRRRSRQELLEALRERCSRILRLAQAQGHTDLVLGAFGCGVFKNDPGDVATVFRDLFRCGGMSGAFRRVVFAIPGARAANHVAFRAVFGGGQAPAPGPGPPGEGDGEQEGEEEQGDPDAAHGGGHGDGRRRWVPVGKGGAGGKGGLGVKGKGGGDARRQGGNRRDARLKKATAGLVDDD